MPVYNASLYLKEAIKSVLDQTHQNFELIIVNDGSTDDSLKIIKQFNDQRIKIVNNKTNLGIIHSRNIGLSLATGEYIANMDADDISLPTRFEKQLHFLETHPNIVILATRLVLVNAKNEETGIWAEDYHVANENDILKTLPVINCIGQPTVMMRASVIKKIGYNIRFKNNEDWGLWLEVMSQGYAIAKLPEILLRYRQHAVNTTIVANESGVEKKIIRFKYQYIKYKISTGSFGNTEKSVFASLVKETVKLCVNFVLPGLYLFAGRITQINKIKFLQQFFAATKSLNNIKMPLGVVYVFPFYHTGGAERVHASIVEAGKQNNAITFITSISENTAFLQQFSKYSTVIEINELLKIGFTERWLMKKIKQIAANNEALRVFGCNSPFFYQLIPYLNNSTIVIDLIHAFVHRYEDGAEKWSLPHVRRIDHRIVISQHSKNDLVQMYKEKGIPESFLSQIEVIPNFVENDQKLNLNSCLDHNKKILKVAYIGRAGEEKRVNLIAKLAKNMSGKAIEFHFVGNLKPFIENEFREYCTFHGEITDDQRLNELYNDFNLVLIASSREGFPMVIMEAMIHGAIPISTNVGGIPEHIKNNENGFLIESTDENEIVNDFEKKILYLVDNRQELIRLSNNVFQYAVNTFSKEKFINAYSKLLKSKS